jgi:hypothetical protein
VWDPDPDLYQNVPDMKHWVEPWAYPGHNLVNNIWSRRTEIVEHDRT